MADRDRPRRTGPEEYDELTRLAAGASPPTAAALRVTRDVLAEALPDKRALAPVDDDDLWLMAAYLRGRLTPAQAAQLAKELSRP